MRSPLMANVARRALSLLLALGVSASAWAQQNTRPQAQAVPQERLNQELWFRSGRPPRPAASRDARAASLLRRAQEQKLNLRRKRVSAYSATSSPQETAWTPLGPAPMLSNASGSQGDLDWGAVSGRVTAIAVDPNDPTGNTVYIGGANGGVWKSSNAAAADANVVTWTPLTDHELTLSTGAIAVQPGNGQVILVGTGEPNLALDSYYGLGILRSSDGGAHWSLITAADSGAKPFAGLGFSKIAFSTDHPNLAVAAASNFIFYPGVSDSGQGLYYSIDYGASWYSAVVKDGSALATQSSVSDVAYNPLAGKFFAAMAWHGIYSSSDGLNWTRLPNQPGGDVLNTTKCPPGGAYTCPILRGEVAVRTGKNEMYVWYISGDLTAGEFTDQGIWKTTDGGATWSAISESGIENCGDFEGCGAAEQGWYSLELAAVPNGATATDLYAASTNIYKCRINSSNPSCAAYPFLNLTHAYGCVPVGSLAHVHPSQHAISYMVASSGQAVMYFGNDGGVYRALDGYGLSSGACSQSPNAFESLNSTLGSLTSLISLSQHPSEAGTILAGAANNGSAATDLSHSGGNGTTWIAVNGGSGGRTAISRSQPALWFTANSGVSVQSCDRGIACLAQDFAMAVSSSTLGGDAGAFVTPYLIDPAADNRMLVGTCRVWRGNSDGSNFAALSFNFDTGVDSPCSGSEENMISSLAGGGTSGAEGSPIIYAGTAAGRIFATTNAQAGPSGWYDATPPLTGFPISSIALNPADLTGSTVYASVMGFGVPHIWKSADAGVSWADVTGDLPDAPADSLLIDPDNHQLVYVGTDVGVFAADMTQSATNWEEIGSTLAAHSLPTVPVTQLAMFKSGELKLLRAATYGRGAWEMVLASPGPDFVFSLNNPVITLFAGQEGSYTGELTSLYGYSSAVTIACEAGGFLLDLCAGETVTPTRGGTSYAVRTRHGSVFDFNFNLIATGADLATTVHRTAATLHVVDFELDFAPGTPAPVALSTNSGSSTDPVELAVQAQGSFSGAVELSCSALPSGAKCNFYPSDAVTFTSAGSKTIAMTISTQQTTPKTAGLPVTISAATAGAPAAKTQTVLLTVKNDPDYQVTSKPEGLRVHPGETVSAQLTFSALSNYKGTVAASCGTSTVPGAACALSSSAVYLTNASSNALTLTLTIPATALVGSYTASVNTHDLSGSPEHTILLSVLVLPDFTVQLPQGSTVTVKQGGTASYALQVTPLGGVFNNPVRLSCSGLPRNSGYSFSPAVVIPGSNGASVTLKVTTSTVLAKLMRPKPIQAIWAAVLLPMLGLALGGLRSLRLRAMLALGIALTILALLFLLAGCGGGASSAAPIVPPPDTATPTGTYTLTLTATSADITHSFDVTLIVQ